MDLLYRLEGQMTETVPIGLVPEGVRLDVYFEGRLTHGQLAGARVRGIDYLLLRADGVGVTDVSSPSCAPESPNGRTSMRPSPPSRVPSTPAPATWCSRPEGSSRPPRSSRWAQLSAKETTVTGWFEAPSAGLGLRVSGFKARATAAAERTADPPPMSLPRISDPSRGASPRPRPRPPSHPPLRRLAPLRARRRA
jgi:hypothetical protein